MSTSWAPEPPRFLSREAYIALLQEIAELEPGKTTTYLNSQWRSDIRWSHNRITMAGDWRNVDVTVRRDDASAFLNQIDPASLRSAVQWIEQMRQRFNGGPPDPRTVEPKADPRTFPATAVWSETTYAQTADTRLDVAAQLIEDANAAGMCSSGYLSVEAEGFCLMLKDGRVEYVPMTRAQCSILVRAPDGNGSGWAGRSSYAWERIGAEELAKIALDKCLKSRNPVRIEPGRYTLIMEPQATFDFTKVLLGQLGRPDYLSLEWNLVTPEAPFHGTKTTTVPVSRYGAPIVLASTKIGERVFDERINLRFDPQDPDLGGVPFRGDTEVYPAQHVQWVTNGVLTALGYNTGLPPGGIPSYGGPLDIKGVPYLESFRLDGAGVPTSVEEMISTTERGLLVTRFWDTMLTDRDHMMLMGMTRDGLWLIERGKIKSPVRNMRWVDSPMFVLNKVEQIGTSVPIFCPGTPGIVPAMKVRDFNFTMLEDTI